ncbi:hypothetical protein BR93DRAFT_929034 [Coniochaeta sp. PMI_546]|nr:hypothetical protein BR93DRAFT_929034 [Coniochaeta sp. PMI_546]
MKRPSKTELKRRFTSIHSWELPKQSSAIAPDYVWVCLLLPSAGALRVSVSLPCKAMINRYL